MGTTATVGSLNLMTIGIVLILAIIAAAWFFRKRSNRHPMGENEGVHSDLDAARRQNTDPARAKDVRR